MKSKTHTNQGIGGSIRIFIKRRGYTYKEVADGVGVSVTTISNWVKGTAAPSGRNLSRLAAFLCISTEDLLGGSDLPETYEGFRLWLANEGITITDIKEVAKTLKKKHSMDKETERVAAHLGTTVEKLRLSNIPPTYEGYREALSGEGITMIDLIKVIKERSESR